MHRYDYLVIATGTRNKPEAVQGLAENTQTITTLPDAEKTALAWTTFVENPGDVVIGATQGASCFGAAYEFLFNTDYQLKKAGIRDRVRLSYVTAEPFLGHFGIGGLPHGEALLGMFLKKKGIEWHTNVALDYVEEGYMITAEGEKLPFAFSMMVPPFSGQDFLRETPGLVNESGFVPVLDSYQSTASARVYAVGLVAAVTAPWVTPTPLGVPKTGFPTEQMAHVAATNIAAKFVAVSPSRPSHLAISPRYASWTQATTAYSSSPTRCFHRANTEC